MQRRFSKPSFEAHAIRLACSENGFGTQARLPQVTELSIFHPDNLPIPRYTSSHSHGGQKYLVEDLMTSSIPQNTAPNLLYVLASCGRILIPLLPYPPPRISDPNYTVRCLYDVCVYLCQYSVTLLSTISFSSCR